MSLPPLPLDPFPGFSTCSLDFPLDRIDQLYDYQLALVAFHPDATLDHKSEAELLFWRRRVARKEADLVDDGQVELDAGLRQLQRARDWLEGKAPSSRPMKDAQVQARPSTKDAQVRTGRRPPPPVPCSTAAADNDDDLQPIQSSSTATVTPATAPTTSRSHDPDAPPGPFFSAFHNGGASLPPPPKSLPLLNQQLHVLWVGGFTKQATRTLFLAFIKRAGPQKFPRPLAISKISQSTYVVGFRTRSEVQVAQRLLHNVALPKMKSKLTATPGTPGTSRTFKWSDFSDDVRGAWLRTGKLPFKRPIYVEMAPAPFKVCVSTEYQAELDRITRIESRLSSAAEAAATTTTTAEARSPPTEADLLPCTAAPPAPALPPATTSANISSRVGPALRQSPAAMHPTPSPTLVAPSLTTTSSTSAPIGPAHAETISKHPPGSLARMEPPAAATGGNNTNASTTSSSSSAISALPLPAPPAPSPGPGPSVVTLPAKPVAPVAEAPLPPRLLSGASLPARPSAANAPQAPAPSAPSAPRLPAPPIAAVPSNTTAPPSTPSSSGGAAAASSSSSIADIFRLPSSSTAATAAAAPTAASHARGPPLSPPAQASFQSAYDDGHDPSSCPCCPPRPPDLHLWTPQRLASVLLDERYRHGEEAFRNLAMDFRAYVQAFGCEALRIRAERMPWYRKRSPRARDPPPATTTTTTTTTAMTAGVVRPAPVSAQVSTDPRKRPRLA